MEKAMAKHSSTLAWKIPWMGEPGRPQSTGRRVGRDWVTSLSCTGEGNGNSPQYCQENPRDGGVWWAAIYGVAQSWTWLKWLSSSSRETNTTDMSKDGLLFCLTFHLVTCVTSHYSDCVFSLTQWRGDGVCVWWAPRGSHFVSGAKCPAACWPALGTMPDGKFDWGSTPVKW